MPIESSFVKIFFTLGVLLALTACRSLPSGGLNIPDSIHNYAFFTPDGSVLITPTIKGRPFDRVQNLQAWNIERRQQVWRYNIDDKTGVIVSPNSTLVAIVEPSVSKESLSHVTIRKTNDGSIVREFDVDREDLWGCERWALSDQGTLVAMTHFGMLLNGPGFPPEGLYWEANRIWAPSELFFNASGDKLVGAFGAGVVIVLSIEQGTVRFISELRPVVLAVWAPFGLVLAIDEDLAGWDGTDLKRWRSERFDTDPHLIRYGSTGYSFYPTTDDDTVVVWSDDHKHLVMIDGKTGNHVWNRELLHSSKVCSNVAITTKTAVLVDCDGNLVELDRATGRDRRRRFLGEMTKYEKAFFHSGGTTHFFYRATFSPDARFLSLDAEIGGIGASVRPGHTIYDVEELLK